MDFQGKVVIITGAAQGIGAAIAEGFAKRGAILALADLNEALAAKLAAQLVSKYGVSCMSGLIDVASPQLVKAFFEKVIEKHQRIDVLVNNAGICQKVKNFEETTEAEWNQILQVNLMGTVNCSNAVIPTFKKQTSGSIINLGSLAGQVGGIAVAAPYAASKAAVMCVTKSLAKYLAPYQVTVNAVAPGFIETEMLDQMTDAAKEAGKAQIPFGRYGKTEEIANTVAFLASEKASYITGQVICVDGGMAM